MDCLDPPLLEIPEGNWYCDDCFETSDESEDDDPEELEDLNNDVDGEIVLPESRLRNRQQPQILRTMQSERIRNAILARMSLRTTLQALGEVPTTSVVPGKPVRKRRATRRRKTRRRARRVVVEYDVDGSNKFAMKTRRVKRRKTKKRRKVANVSKKRAVKTSAGPSTSFKNINANVHDLQRGRMKAGLSGFNIFQPTNQLDYVPDEEDFPGDSGIEEIAENSNGNMLTQAIIGLSNPHRRSMMIKNRVLQNCTTTSGVSDLLDSIMQDQDMFGPGSIRNRFSVEKSSGKLLFVGANEKVKGAAGHESSESGGDSSRIPSAQTAGSSIASNQAAFSNEPLIGELPTQEANENLDDGRESQNLPSEIFTSKEESKKKKQVKKPEIDMFDEDSTPQLGEDCPNFSIYDSVDAITDQASNSNSFQVRPMNYDEDLVQMSDTENQDDIQPAIVASQPASPDVEIDKVGELIPERSYTPPIAQKTYDDDGPERDDYDTRRDREARRNRKRELERYNVRDRLNERSPVRLKDKFGRNRSRSSSRRRHSRRDSASRDRPRKSNERNFQKSRSRSRRTPSIDYDRKKKLHKEKSKTYRKSRSRSLTPRHRPTTPDHRRERSSSKKLKKNSKEKLSKLTKEVFTSGPNILVSVNFNNQEKSTRSYDTEPKEIVDITAKKKITVSSRPIAVIDLARSPFRVMTPEYQVNVIEVSDSDGEKTSEKPPPKSPDSSSKLYDPFDILNSPTNENITSSQNTAALLPKPPEKVAEPVKLLPTYNKNIMAMAANSGLFFNEENLVSSSSSNVMIDKLLTMPPAAKIDSHQDEKSEAIPMDIAESPYSPGHEYIDSSPSHDNGSAAGKPVKVGKGANIFDELFGSSTPPGLDRIKGKKGKKSNFFV